MWQSLLGALVGQGSDSGMQFASKAYDQYLWKKNLRDYAELQYEYAQRYSENSPAWNIKGLRDAGLNPILAVSNGVNLGANVPNFSSSSPSGMVKSDFGGKIDAALDRSINQQNADTNEQNAQSNALQAQAAMMEAQSESALKQAQAAKTIQDTQFDKEGGGYRNDIVSDMVRSASKGFKDVDALIDFIRNSGSSYLENGPSYRMNETEGKIFRQLHSEYGDAAYDMYMPAKRERDAKNRLKYDR